MDFSNLSFLSAGGVLMWPLGVISFFCFIIAVERTLYLHKAQIKTQSFLDGIKNLLHKRRLLEALTVCEETPGPVPSVVKAALLHYNESEQAMRLAISEAATVEIPVLERRIGALAMIAKVAPMFGLLGTFVAFLQGFYTMTLEGPYANASSFSSDLSQAMLTTIAGVAIAIVANLVHHFLASRVRAIVNDMEWVAISLIQYLLRDLPEEEAASDSIDFVQEKASKQEQSPKEEAQ